MESFVASPKVFVAFVAIVFLNVHPALAIAGGAVLGYVIY